MFTPVETNSKLTFTKQDMFEVIATKPEKKGGK